MLLKKREKLVLFVLFLDERWFYLAKVVWLGGVQTGILQFWFGNSFLKAAGKEPVRKQ